MVGLTGLLRGPLMQRATSVQIRDTHITGTIDVGIAASMDESWGGTVSGRQKSVVLSSNFSTVLTAYQNRDQIKLSTAPCDNCTMSVKVRLHALVSGGRAGAHARAGFRLRCQLHDGHETV